MRQRACGARSRALISVHGGVMQGCCQELRAQGVHVLPGGVRAKRTRHQVNHSKHRSQRAPCSGVRSRQFAGGKLGPAPLWYAEAKSRFITFWSVP
jgi:hypothetical protein